MLARRARFWRKEALPRGLDRALSAKPSRNIPASKVLPPSSLREERPAITAKPYLLA